MITLTLTLSSSHPGSIWFELHPSSYSEAIKETLKSIPGFRWIWDATAPNKKGFYLAPIDAVEVALDIVEQAKLAKVVRPDPATLPIDSINPGIVSEVLYEYQLVGASWIVQNFHSIHAAILADDMGLGKTAQAIAALDKIDGIKQIICPAVVERHWRNEISLRSSDPVSYRVTSYDKFKGKKSTGFDPATVAVCLDEFHYLANAKSQRAKAIRVGLDSLPLRPKLLGLTGTPIPSEPSDLFNSLDLLFPNRFGTFWGYTARYCGGQYKEIEKTDKSFWDYSGATNQPELNRRLKHVMLRRTKSEVALQLPTFQRILMPVELPKRTLKSLAKVSSFQWDPNATTNWKNEGNRVGSILSATEDHKIDAAVDLANEAIKNGRKVLLFTTRRETAKRIGIALNCPVVDGETPATKRAEILTSSNVGVATVHSVTTGVNLSHFDVAIFVGLDWLPSTLLQAEARLHRIGQTLPVTIYYLIGLGTIDEIVQNRVIERLSNFEKIIGNEDSNLKESLSGGTEDELIAGILGDLMKAS